MAWIVQEMPSFFLPLILSSQAWSQISIAQKALLCMFMTHYFQRYATENTLLRSSRSKTFKFSIFRSFIYPFLSKSGKPSPFPIVLSAFFFCSFNGFLQVNKINDAAEAFFVLQSLFFTSSHFFPGPCNHILQFRTKPN